MAIQDLPESYKEGISTIATKVAWMLFQGGLLLAAAVVVYFLGPPPEDEDEAWE